MNRFNHHLSNHFGSCLFLAKGYDPYRKREVEFRALPGEFSIVGITDGVDAWVAPVHGPVFSVDVGKILQNLQNGIMPGQQAKPRHRIVVPIPTLNQEDPPKPKERVRVVIQAPPRAEAPSNPQPRLRTRIQRPD